MVREDSSVELRCDLNGEKHPALKGSHGEQCEEEQ